MSQSNDSPDLSADFQSIIDKLNALPHPPTEIIADLEALKVRAQWTDEPEGHRRFFGTAEQPGESAPPPPEPETVPAPVPVPSAPDTPKVSEGQPADTPLNF